LITRFNLYSDLAPRVSSEALIQRMRREIHLEFKSAEQTGGRMATVAFTVSYAGRDPETVARVTNTLASFFVEENLRGRERQATGTAEFLSLQLEATKKRLDEQERRINEFKLRHPGELPQQMEVNRATLERLSTQFHLNNDLQIRAMERRAALVKQLAEADGTGADTRNARLARLKAELSQLQMRFTDKYPDMIRVKSEIATLERQLAEATSEGKSEARPAAADPSVRRLKEGLSDVEAELKALKSAEKDLREAVATYQRRVENTPQREQELQELSRDYGATKELYYSLMKRYEDAQLAESMEQRQKGEQFRILDPAIVSKNPVGPNRVRLAVKGLMLALGAAIGAMVVAERLDTSLHTTDDLRRLTSVPVLAVIPVIATKADVRRRRRRFWLGAVSAAMGLALVLGASYYIGHGNDQLVWMLTPGRS
jgi:polysaccharide chain length determinant protein (PEP-CTERM system associated)